jgi:hypothetical protein
MFACTTTLVLFATLAIGNAFVQRSSIRAIARTKISEKNVFQNKLNVVISQRNLQLNAAEVEPVQGFEPSAWLNPNTRGGVIVWSVLLTLVPLGAYNFFVASGYEDTQVGAYVGAIFVLLTNLLWASTYIFRVANKDMTYAKQLRDYENAVLQKRLDELADDEITALMEEIELEEGESILDSSTESSSPREPEGAPEGASS